jgi:hypothetical protein
MSNKPKYDDICYLIIVGDSWCTGRWSRIIDSIHLNGCTGHSFRINLWKDKKPVIQGGGFDGDGADRVDFICLANSELLLDNDEVCNKLDWLEHMCWEDKGDNILIVKGTYCGISAIYEVFKTAMNMCRISGDSVEVKTNDRPEVLCGSYSYYENDKPFAFAIVTVQEGPWSNPIKWFTEHGYDINFFRGHVD